MQGLQIVLCISQLFLILGKSNQGVQVVRALKTSTITYSPNLESQFQTKIQRDCQSIKNTKRENPFKAIQNYNIPFNAIEKYVFPPLPSILIFNPLNVIVVHNQLKSYQLLLKKTNIPLCTVRKPLTYPFNNLALRTPEHQYKYVKSNMTTSFYKNNIIV